MSWEKKRFIGMTRISRRFFAESKKVFRKVIRNRWNTALWFRAVFEKILYFFHSGSGKTNREHSRKGFNRNVAAFPCFSQVLSKEGLQA